MKKHTVVQSYSELVLNARKQTNDTCNNTNKPQNIMLREIFLKRAITEFRTVSGKEMLSSDKDNLMCFV